MRRRVVSLLLALVLAFGLLPMTVLADWTAFRGNGKDNMAITDAPTPKPGYAALSWSKALGGSGYGNHGQPLLIDGALVLAIKNKLNAYSCATGDLIASVSMAQSTNNAYVPLSYADGTVYVPQNSNSIGAYKFDGKKFSVKWETKFAVAEGSSEGFGVSPILCCDGKLYLGFSSTAAANDYEFICVDAEKGELLWRYAHQGGFYWAGAVEAGDYIIVGSEKGKDAKTATLFSFKKTYGANELDAEKKATPVQAFETPGVYPIRSSMAYKDGSVYFTGRNGYLCSAKVNADGSFSNFKKEAYGAGESTSTPVVYGDYVYFGTGSLTNASVTPYLRIARRDTLEVVKSVELPEYPQAPGLLSTAYEKTDGSLYFYVAGNNAAGGLYCVQINAKDPTEAKAFEIFCDREHSGNSLASPICDDAGNLYYHNDANYLYKITTATSAVPMISKNLTGVTAKYQPGTKAQGVEVLTIEAWTAEGATLSYRWEKSTDGENWEPIPGAEGPSYTSYTPVIPASVKTKQVDYYRCVVTASLNGVDTQTVSDAAVITTQSFSTDTSIRYIVTGSSAAPNAQAQASKTSPDKQTIVLNFEDYKKEGITQPRLWFAPPENGTMSVRLDPDVNENGAKLQNNSAPDKTYPQRVLFGSGVTGTTIVYVTATAEDGETTTEYTFAMTTDGTFETSVTFSLLGDTNHGESGEVHTLKAGNLETWIAPVEIKVPMNATVLDVLGLATAAQKDATYQLTKEADGSYISAISRKPKGGKRVTLAQQDNGVNSGWMYTINGAYSELAVNQQTVKKGDVIVFHYTDDYTKEQMREYTPEEVQELIDAIGTVSKESGSAIMEARNAYDSLSEEQKELVSNLETLLEAERAYAELTVVDWQTAYRETGALLLEQAEKGTCKPGSVGGEWLMLGLSRSEKLFGGDAESYVASLEASVRKNINKAGQLKKNGSALATENARVALAVTALGYDARAFAEKDLLAAFADTTWIENQGNNASAYALLALNAKEAYLSEDQALTVAAKKLVESLLKHQKADGSWAINTGDGDLDTTAMVVTALAEYRDDAQTADAISKALEYLAGQQKPGGAIGTSPETTAQVVVALSTLGLDAATDGRFMINGRSVLQGLLQFYAEGGGFARTTGGSVNQMSSEQGYYALAAYDRYCSGKNSLYKMDDAKKLDEAAFEEVMQAIADTAVEKADRETYLALRELERKIRYLKDASNIDEAKQALAEKRAEFDALLKIERENAQERLSKIYDEVVEAAREEDESLLTKEAEKELQKILAAAEEKLRSADHIEEIEQILKQARADMENALHKIHVSFRLIGDFQHETSGDEHMEYVTWIETKKYAVNKDATVKDLLQQALAQAELDETGADEGYVSSVLAPEVLGGYWLSEMDNGANSGWMYTVNGEHPDDALDDFELEDGDRVIWHYVDDYTTDVDSKPWLKAADISPEEYAKDRIGRIATASGRGEIAPKLRFSDLGTDVTFTFEPEKNQELMEVVVDGKSVGKPERYVYQNLSLSSRIEASFTGTMNFIDVRRKDWFYQDVKYVVENGLFHGTAPKMFSPNEAMTRGMLVTVLYRLADKPETLTVSSFADVAQEKYYAQAISWAHENGIVGGMTQTSFAPEEKVTREQLAVILYRFAKTQGRGAGEMAELTGFADYSRISGYALEALSWANGAGLVSGRSETELAPQGQATRAEVAAILHRFAENVAK